MTGKRKPVELVQSHGDKRGYSWPPFEEGNQAALTHGARSDRVLDAKVQELRVALFEVAPDLDQPRFAETIERYLRSVAREKLLHEFLMERGADKAAVRLWEGATAAANASQKMADALGLTPAGWHKLKALWGEGVRAEHDVAALESLAAQGRVLRERADAVADAVEEGEDESA